tara:strand:+ start:549 stop:1340 length:792 start_codon:yes stop_codon:yes gene_type:complete
MFPVLFDIGGFKLLTSGVMWFLGFCCTATVLLKISRDQSLSFGLLIKMAVACLLGGIIGARLGYIHLYWEFFINNPIDMLKFYEGGMVYYWGLAGGIITGLAFWRGRSGWIRICDIMILSLLPAQVMGRIGCYLHGCCFGITYDNLPYLKALMVRFPTETILRHPVQLYSGIGLALIFIGLWFIYKRLKIPGLVIISYIYCYATFRFTIEFLRADSRGHFWGIFDMSTSQEIGVVTILLMTSYLLALRIGWLPKPKVTDLPKS